MPRGERPLDVNAGMLTRFAADLRLLRREAGGTPYRELARRAHYSAGTLSDAAGGRKLPSLSVTLAYVRTCGGDVEEWERRWHAVAGELADQVGDAPDDEDDGPYVGLAAFQTADAARFCGRETLVEEIGDRVRRQRFLAVFGASGTGKSSLLRAGLVPSLSESDEAGQRRTVLLFTPGAQPLEECAVQLASLTTQSAASVRDDLLAGSDGLHLWIRTALAERDDEAEVVLVVDQFEEVFTVCRSPDERNQFIDALLAAVRAPDSRARVVLGVRTDFYTHCARHAALAAALAQPGAQALVGPMSVEQLRRVIVEPANRAGYLVEGGLLAAVTAEATGQPGALPLVSHALRETWRRRAGARLTMAGYEAAGGIRFAVAHSADNVYRDLDAAQRRIAQDLFLRLIALGDGTEDTKRRVSRHELSVGDPNTAVVLARLVQTRLLVADEDTVEIAHEALIRHWPRLRQWLAADREGLRIQRDLTEATDVWESLGHDPAVLYRGIRLDQASTWADSAHAVPTARERAFLTAGVRAREEEETRNRRRVRRLRQLVAAVVVFGLIATGAAVAAVQQRSAAITQRDQAVFGRMVAEADRLRSTDPSLSAQLDLAAYRMRPGDQGLYTRLISAGNAPLATPLRGHTGAVYLTSFSPNGRVLATAGEDHTVRLWNVTDPTHAVPLGKPLTGHTSWVSSAVFAPDGRTLATAGDDGTVRLWNVTDPARPVFLGPPLTGDNGTIYLVAFSPDGRTLATADEDHTVRLWNVTDPAHAVPLGKPLTGHTAPVRAVAFSPDGRTLAAAGDDGTVALWNVADPTRAVRDGRALTRHGGIVHSLAFSPDGRVLASGAADRTVRLWNVADPAHVTPLGRPLTGHTGAVWSVTFSPDGHLLATAGDDSTVRLWNVTDPADVTTLGPPLVGSSGDLYAVGFSPDGHTVVAGGSDGLVRLWSLPPSVLVGERGNVTSLALSPSGRLLAAGADDNTTGLWNVADPTRPVLLSRLPAAPGYVQSCTACQNAVRFDPDGRVLATLSYDKVVQLWDVADPAHPTPLGTALVLGTRYSALLAFSPDGRTLVSGSDDNTVQLWDVTAPGTPRPLAQLSGHTSFLTFAAFSPDGRILATASDDATVRLWNTGDRAHPRFLGSVIGNTSGVNSVAFAPDGHVLATAGTDATVRLWNIADPSHPVPIDRPLTGHTDSVSSVAFDPGGRVLASASADRTVRLWNVANPAVAAQIGLPVSSALAGTGSALAFTPHGHFLVSADDAHAVRLLDLDVEHAIHRICASTRGVLTAREWQLHVPDLPYRSPCDGG